MESSSTQLPPELAYSPSSMMNYLKMGEQFLVQYVFNELFPLVRIIETMFDPNYGQLIVSDTRQAVIIREGSVITYSITDWHYPDKECDFGTGIWSVRPQPSDFDDLRVVERTGFFTPDYALTQIAVELNL